MPKLSLVLLGVLETQHVKLTSLIDKFGEDNLQTADKLLQFEDFEYGDYDSQL